MIQVKGLRTQSSSEEKDGAIQVALALAAAEATTGDGAVRDFALDFSLHDVDAVAMKKLQEFIEANSAQAGLSDEQRGQLVVTQMQALSGELLARKPSLAIDRLNFIYQDEPFTATARVQYVGSGNIAAFNPISEVVGSVSFEAPQSAVQRVVETRQLNALRQQHAQRMIASGVVSEPRLEELGQMEAQAKAISGPVIQDLIAQQTLLPAGGNRLKAEAKIESGRITLNGRPWISLPVPGGAEPVPTW
jgi:uncharacterized protein YdgA (DUF945 family)